MKYEKKPISAILRSPQTVFTFRDIALLWGGTDKEAAKAAVSYYVNKGDLYRIRRGIYAKSHVYDKRELATKIVTPAYVSFETVLSQAGVVFQHYEKIMSASYTTREVTADRQKFLYRKLKDAVLTNNAGLIDKGTYMIASAERAFLDVLYLHKGYHFDNLRPIDWNTVNKILPIYGGNLRMARQVKEFSSQA